VPRRDRDGASLDEVVAGVAAVEIDVHGEAGADDDVVVGEGFRVAV
jgi:hypothetical protein